MTGVQHLPSLVFNTFEEGITMARSWKVEAIRGAARAANPDAPASAEDRLFRAISAAADGLTLAQCRNALSSYGRARRDEALSAVRTAQWCDEATEQRPNSAGRMQKQTVLRLKAT